MNKPFSADQFTATKWDTPEDKLWFARQFVKFVESGFSKHYFAKKFYDQLIRCFGLTALYDIHGFWREYFESTQDKLKFVRQCLSHVAVGDPRWTHSDVERELIKWLVKNDAELQLYREAEKGTEAAERAELAKLKVKYEGETQSPDLKKVLMELGNKLVQEHGYLPGYNPHHLSTDAIVGFTRWINNHAEAHQVLEELGLRWSTVEEP